MLPLISPSSYYDPSVHHAEIEAIFLRRWIFVGDARQLPNHQDFRVLELGGLSVILQNFDGSIKAFNNVCSHRFARIHGQTAGNRELRCPYHGWIYNSEGLPYAIPRKPLIAEITPTTLCDYRLSRWHVQTVGPLLFIKKEYPGECEPLEGVLAQLGAYAQTFAELASACGEMIEYTEHLVQANWKVVVENTLEGYHVDCVHPTTIGKLGMAGLSTAERTRGPDPARQKPSYFTSDGENSAVFSELKPEISARLDRTYGFLARRPQKLEGYRHFYCFPNFVFASTRGESFSLQRILPLAEGVTQLTSFLFATNGLGELSKMEMALRRQFNLAAADFVRAVFAEDAGICEEVQHGVRFAHTRGVLSDEEERICHFHKAYLAALSPNR